MKISIILGTRPEIIKFSPVIRLLEQKGEDFFILHSGQHYSAMMDSIFFKELKLTAPKYNLNCGSNSHAVSTAKMLIGIEEILQKEKPDVVLVQGDTNTVLAGALAASKLNIKIGHIEAGLRSYDGQMPEETNRIIADAISDYLFAPTLIAEEVLLKEGKHRENIFLCGNTIVDAVWQNIVIAEKTSEVLAEQKLERKGYFLATFHRQENTDCKTRLSGIIEGLGLASEEQKKPVICPLHPRTESRIKKFGIEIPKGLRLIPSQSFFSFLMLEKNASLIFTDSGGVQEEACVLGVPCVTLRDNTERGETIQVGANILSGANPRVIAQKARVMIEKPGRWQNPFGDGKASEKILKVVKAGGCDE